MHKRLLKRARKDVFDVILAAGLDPIEFEWGSREALGGWDEQITYTFDCLFHVETQFYFGFDREGEEHVLQYSPGPESETKTVGSIGSWQSVVRHVVAWAEYLHAELATPDPWANLSIPQLEGTDVALAEQVGDAPFSVEEIAALREALQATHDFVVKNATLDDQHRAWVRERFDYLKYALERQSRRDWFHTCLGVITTLAVAVPVDVLSSAWRVIGSVLSGIVQLPAP